MANIDVKIESKWLDWKNLISNLYKYDIIIDNLFLYLIKGKKKKNHRSLELSHETTIYYV